MFGLVMPEFAQRPWRRNQHRPAAVHGGEGCHRDVWTQKQGRLFMFGGIQGLTFIPGFFQRKSRIDMIFLLVPSFAFGIFGCKIHVWSDGSFVAGTRCTRMHVVLPGLMGSFPHCRLQGKFMPM